MDGGMDGGAGSAMYPAMLGGIHGGADGWFGYRTGATAGEEVAAMKAALHRHAAELEDIHRHALSVTLLSWESPAGLTFRSYLAERCTELFRTVDLLESAARELGAFQEIVCDAEAQQSEAGL